MWTVWFVATYLFGARAAITQISSLLLREGVNATLPCSQDNNHNNMYWYLQQPGKGLQLIYFSYGESDVQEGDIHAGYKAKRLKVAEFNLYISPVKRNHSAVYFCASSLDTTLQSHLFSLHK
ncbi:TVB4 protein, partial [Atlantisia rogersi]|nr:TVB4 protein [Atlantisia rogersi]